jgi:MFS family permease
VKLKEQHEIVSIKSHNRLLNGRRTCSESESTVSEKSSVSGGLDYKYTVLLASFCAYMLAALLSSCFGVFFESMQADLGWSKGQCGFVGALLSALGDLAGPISSAMTNRYGCRRTTIFGGLIAAFGVIASAYVEDFWLLSFLLGGVSGFGSSLVLVASVVVVTYYFEEKPSLAAGLTISGASFGQSIFTMIIIALNEHYGRSGCFLILGKT